MNAWAFLAYIDRQQNYITQCRFLKKPTAHRQQWLRETIYTQYFICLKTYTVQLTYSSGVRETILTQ